MTTPVIKAVIDAPCDRCRETAPLYPLSDRDLLCEPCHRGAATAAEKDRRQDRRRSPRRAAAARGGR